MTQRNSVPTLLGFLKVFRISESVSSISFRLLLPRRQSEGFALDAEVTIASG